ncbi:MAG: hypothetical protein KJ067_01870 [Vicinamibacteria bacterium]|nr:hypothetical protein [Vicinamibacteria bacterium]
MFERLARSWELTKASLAVLSADKELLVYPLLSGLASVLVLATFAIPALLAGIGDRLASGEDGARVLGTIVAFAFYVTQYFVILFCNTALVGAAMIRLRGGDPTVGDGFKVAFARLGTILGYAVVSATVGMLLRALAQRGGALGRIASSMFGLAWGLATFLVVPVLVVEDVGPVDAVRRSAAYLKRTWGEQLAGNLGMGAVFGAAALVVGLAGVAGLVAAAAMGSGVLAAAVAVAMVVAFVALSLVSSALAGIYSAAVYRYAADGNAGGFFPERLVKDAFASR